MQAKRQTKKTVKTGERENLQPAAMTTADRDPRVASSTTKKKTTVLHLPRKVSPDALLWCQISKKSYKFKPLTLQKNQETNL